MTARRPRPAHHAPIPLLLISAVVTTITTGCGSAPKRESRVERGPDAAQPQASISRKRSGGYYLDDGPGEAPPPDLDRIAEPVPQPEPLVRGTLRPYVVMGQTFTPMTELQPYKARGVATWYGRRYHGKQTASGEIYDMYAISAAHPTLPIPSYARVTNLSNGKSVVVRINDRGPFLENRLIDLSYTAAHRIGVLAGGSALVEVEAILPDGSAPATAFALAPPAHPRGNARPPVAAPALAAAAQSDPIVAIAAAARDAVPLGAPLPDAGAHSQSYGTPAAARESAAGALAAKAPSAPEGRVYLQLGAFGSRENAETYLARAKVQMEWLTQQLDVVARDGLYRVYAGPYSSVAEGRAAAERIGLALGMKPVLTIR